MYRRRGIEFGNGVMKKLLKWLLIVVIVLIVGLGVAGLVGWRYAHARPTWFKRPALSDVDRKIAANNADQKLLQTYSAAQEAQAAATRAERAGETAGASGGAAKASLTINPAPITIELTEDELNAFYDKWEAQLGLNRRLANWVDQPTVILDANELILAATMKQEQTVMSLHFYPHLQDGMVSLAPLEVRLGEVTLPRSIMRGYLDKFDQSRGNKYLNAAKEAEINPRGWANSKAVEAATEAFLHHVFSDEPVEPVIFLRDLRAHDRYLPMRILSLEIADKTLRATVRLMTPDEREALQQRLRGPNDAETGVGK